MMDLEMIAEVRVKNDDGEIEMREMSIRSILMGITIEVLGAQKPLFFMITTNREGECEASSQRAETVKRKHQRSQITSPPPACIE